MALGEVRILDLDSVSSVSTSALSTDGNEEEEDIDQFSNEEIEQLFAETL